MKNESSNIKRAVVILCIVAAIAGALLLFPPQILSINGLLDKGLMYQKTGRTALALKIYEKAVKDYPSSYQAHLRLGNALLEVDEPELARKQFDIAVELSGNSNNKFDAQIAMSTMLLADKNYEKAENVLLSVEEPRPDEVKKALADLYINLGDLKFSENKRKDAVDNYKKAFKCLDKIDVEAQQKIEDKLIRSYNDIANFYLTQKLLDKAIETLKESNEFIDNSSSHIKLAEIYKKQNKMDQAIEQYQSAYDLDTTGTAALYLGELLVDKGVGLAKQNKMDEAKKCFEQAQEANPSIVIPAEIMYSLSFVSIKTDLIQNTVEDKIFPKVNLVLKNDSNESVDSLKLQAVFMDSGNIIGRTEKTVVDRDNALAPNSTTESVSLMLDSGVNGLKKPHMIQVKIYISYGKNSDWKFARTLAMSKKSNVFDVKKSKPKTNTTTSSKPASNPVMDTVHKPSSIDHQNNPVESVANPQNNATMNNTSAPQPVSLPVMVQQGASDSKQTLPPINKAGTGSN